MDDLVSRMRTDLTAAMRARDRATTAVLRAALGAVANAEAVPVPAAHASVGDGPVAGAATGVGATEAPRRVLSPAEVRDVVRAERDERLAAAAQLDDAGARAAADELRESAAVLDRYL